MNSCGKNCFGPVNNSTKIFIKIVLAKLRMDIHVCLILSSGNTMTMMSLQLGTNITQQKC